MNNKSIHFIMTGGTIDSYFDGFEDKIVPHKESVTPRYIKSLKLHIDTEFTQICMKDSRDIKLDDMQKIADIVESSEYGHFIVTHGTYTMPDTGRYLKEHLKRKDAVVILTGSLIPVDFAISDGLFNLGYSVAEIFHLDPGVYVSMNGRIFEPAEIAKLMGEGRFVSISTNSPIFGNREDN